jgi:hypothetical protein
MILRKKFLYSVDCQINNWTEVHYEVLQLTFRSKEQSPFVMLWKEYIAEITNHAEILFRF